MRFTVIIAALLALVPVKMGGTDYLFRRINSDDGLPDNNVRNVLMLPDGMMCIQTPAMLNFYDGESFKSCHFNSPKYRDHSMPSRLFYKDSCLWYLTEDYAWKFDLTVGRFEYGDDALPDMQDGEGILTEPLNSVPEIKAAGAESNRTETAVSADGTFWIMFDTKIIRYSPATGQIDVITDVPLGQNDVYTTIAMDCGDRLWVGTKGSGVSILDTKTMEVENLVCLETYDGQRIGHNTEISQIYVDPQDGMWIATGTEGVLYWHKDIFRISSIGGEILDAGVQCLLEDAGGRILLGTAKGLKMYDPVTGEINVAYPELGEEVCSALYRDENDRIWLGTFDNGFFCIDRGRVRHYYYDGMPSIEESHRDGKPNFNSVSGFCQDRFEELWVCVYGGLGRLDPSSGWISLLRDSHPEVGRFMLINQAINIDKGIYVVSDEGMYFYDPFLNAVTLGSNEINYSLPCNQMLEDDRGYMWFGSPDGLYCVSPDGKSSGFSTRNGLPDNNILGIAADEETNEIWVATFNALCRLRVMIDEDGIGFGLTAFGSGDGMSVGTLCQNSMLVASDGRIYAGGSHGFCIAEPAALYQRRKNAVPTVTGMRIFNQPVEVGEEYDGRRILTKALSQTEHIRLRHNETFLTFEFSALNYINPGHTNYRYRLRNFDKTWTELHGTATGSATYTLLRPGDYVFEVMAADNDRDWGGECARLAFTIRPSFWQSGWSKVLFAFLFCLLAAAVFYSWMRRTREKAELRAAEERRRQKEEMDAMKFSFFTNVSHELRTPLSLIILPLESIIKSMAPNSPILPQLQMMHRNASGLLSMVNQLLDFRKLDMHAEKVNYTHGDIAEYVGGIVRTFRDTARERELHLSFDCGLENTAMDFDADKVHKIVVNLVSNAIKFTPAGGEVAVRMMQTGTSPVTIEVSDTGVGISQEDQAHIFDRFYQVQGKASVSGTGIGLNIVRQYAEMLGGRVSVQSEIGVGSTFRVELPLTIGESAESAEEAVVQEKAVESDVEHCADEGPAEEENQRTRLLVVEDNADFRDYLAGELSGEFDVIKAVDGEDGLRKGESHVIDIIICDVMMPHMDGFEFCRRLKTDINTSHIPIILLTAYSDDEMRRRGYEAGADAYVSKPFNMDLLLARIRNLIEERRRRIRAFASGAEEISAEGMTATPLDRQMMDKVMECVRRNMGNPNYSIEDLASDVSMHRMNLYRKLRTITGTTPLEFIRTIRLRQAARLLVSEPDLSVTEIYERVGFITHKNFVKHFTEMFGCTPSVYRKKNASPA